MIESVSSLGPAPAGATSQSTAGVSATKEAAAAARTNAAPPASVSSDPATRLHLERDAAGSYVYRLVDVATGRVLAELPRGSVGQLTDLSGYQPGVLASATA